MLNKIIYVDKNKEMLVLKADVGNGFEFAGYDVDPSFEGWETNKEEYMEDNDIFFCVKNAFPTEGIYKVIGYDSSESNTPEGYMDGYMVEKIEKLYDIKL